MTHTSPYDHGAKTIDFRADYERLLDFLHKLPIGVGRLDERGDISILNPEAARILQSLCARAPITNFFDAVDHLAPQLRDMANAYLPSKGSICERYTITPKNRGAVVGVVSVSLYKSEPGVVMLTMRDVSQIFAQEEALSKSNKLLVLSQKLAHVGHYYYSVARREIELSDEIHRIAGRDPRPGPLHLSNVFAWMHPEDVGMVAELSERALENGEGFEREVRVPRPDGDMRETLCRCEVDRDTMGMVVGLYGIIKDITDAKRAERDQARLRDAAEQASRAKTTFLATMSHELRTPMTAIIGMNDLLMDTGLNPEQSEIAGGVQKSANALLGILDDVLDAAKLDAGRVTLTNVEFDVGDVVDDVVRLMSASAKQKGLSIVSSITGVEGSFRGDPDRIRQILINLVANAIKFSARGAVKILVTRTSPEVDKARLRFEVVDEGIGVPEAAKGRIFQAFEQADGSVTRVHGGSGLGLSISRGLVELMHGEIGVSDRDGGGSVFWFEIDLLKSSREKGRVLIVEDNKVIADIPRLVYKKMGLTTRVATNGVDAVNAARDEVFDLILMDLQSPRLDGLEATRRIRALSSGSRDAPIVALTARDSSENEDCRAAGIDDYLPKPTTPANLRAVAMKWLDIRQAV